MRPTHSQLRAPPAGPGGSSALVLMLLLASLLAGFAVPRLAPSQSSVPSTTDAARTARDVVNRTMSPFCPGLLLANCPSPSADSLRRAILARAQAGASRQTIEAELIAEYGESVRGSPEARGFGLVAWLTPAVLLLVAGVGTAVWVRRAARAGAGTGVEASGASAIIPDRDLSEPSVEADRAAELERLAELVRQDGAR